jgi:hypothetical protein
VVHPAFIDEELETESWRYNYSTNNGRNTAKGLVQGPKVASVSLEYASNWTQNTFTFRPQNNGNRIDKDKTGPTV